MGVKVKPWKGQKGTYGVFINHHGQRKAKKVGDKRAAEAVASEIRRRLAEGTFRLPQRGQAFEALAEEWIEKYPLVRSVSQTTMENYISFIRHHLIPYFKSTPVTDIGYSKVEAFIAEKRGPRGSARFPGKPIAEQSLRVGLVALRLILDRAVKAGILPANPAVGVARFKRNDEDTVDPFTGEELRATLAAASRLNPAFATFLRLWMQCGTRQGEMSALQNQDLDLLKGIAVVRRTWTRGRLGPTKTRQTRMVSFLHPVTEGTLEWRPGVTQESRRILAEIKSLPVRSLEPEAFVFGVHAPWSPAYINGEWRRMLQAAKVRYRNPEQLRHTFASTLLSRNAPSLYIQQQGGWRSAAVLFQVYARWMPHGQLNATPAQPQPEAISINARQIEGDYPIMKRAGTSRSSHSPSEVSDT